MAFNQPTSRQTFLPPQQPPAVHVKSKQFDSSHRVVMASSTRLTKPENDQRHRHKPTAEQPIFPISQSKASSSGERGMRITNGDLGRSQSSVPASVLKRGGRDHVLGRPAPPTPPSSQYDSSAPSRSPETSYIDWDDREDVGTGSALAKVKQSLAIAHRKQRPMSQNDGEQAVLRKLDLVDNAA